MKFKERIKKALFAFFKEEIMNEFTLLEQATEKKVFSQPFGEIERFKFSEKIYEMEQISVDFSFEPESRMHSYPIPVEIQIEQASRKARQMLFDKFCDYVQMDATHLIKPEYSERSRLRFNVWVGKRIRS